MSKTIKKKIQKIIKPMKQTKTIVFTGLILILVVVGAYFLFGRSSEALADWFDTSWHYRKAITIDNSGSAQTDFQVLVTVDTSDTTKFQDDCDDLRFTSFSGQALDYWIESGCSTATTKIWVKISSIPTNTSTIYMYYGNSGAGALSNPANIIGNSANPGVSCTEIHNNRNAPDGVYYINPSSGPTNGAFEVYCDMTTDNGGWTIFAVINTADISMVNTDDAADHVLTYDGKFSNNAYAPTSYSQTESSNIALTKLIDAGESIDFMRYDITDNIIGINYGTIYSSSSRSIGGECGDGFPAHTNFVTYGHKYPGIGSKHGWQGGTSHGIYIGYSGSTPTDSEDCKYFGSATYNTGHYKMFYGVRNVAPNSVNISATLQSEEKSPGPIAYWKFDEGVNDTCPNGTDDVCDSTTNNNDGAITNATWQTEDMCVSGKCLQFDGDGDWINVTHNSNINFGLTDFSQSFWAKGGVVNENPILDKHLYSTGAGWYSYMNNGKISTCLFTSSWGKYICSHSTAIYGDNIWHHFVINVKRATSEIDLYVDGKEVEYSVHNSNTNSFGSTDNISNSQPLQIGKNLHTNGQYFVGELDEVKIYPYARTAGQIKADHVRGATSIGSAMSVSGKVSPGTSGDIKLSDGLVGYWKMDEGSWGTVADSSGNGNDGTAQGDAAPGAGKFGNGGNFDGDGDYVSIGDLDYINTGNSGEYTVSTLVKFDTISQSFFLGDERSSNEGVMLQINSSGYIQTYHPTTSYMTSSYQVTTDQWYQITLLQNSNGIHLYVDGEFIETLNSSPLHIDTSDTTYLGRFYSGRYLDGTLDSVRIYNRALSAREVRHLYEWAPGPVGHWKMDEHSGTTANDSSGNGNNGVITGAIYSLGKNGTALKFDDDDYFEVPINSIFNFGTGDWTFSTWVNPSVIDTCDTIFAQNNPYYILRLGCAGPVTTYDVYHAGNQYTTSAHGMSADNWYYVTLVRNNDTLKIYQNGIDLGWSQNITNQSTDMGNAVWRIGDSTWASETWQGKIDDVRIYNYARTQKQILEDMAGSRPAQKQMVGYWKFNEGYGNAARDAISGSSSVANATGGTITEVGGYRIHTFTSSGTFTPTTNGNVEVLVVAGGGGGGSSVLSSGGGGGGGAGGLRHDASFSINQGQYSVIVGTGGAPGGTNLNQPGSNGGDSSFSTISATAGGGGAKVGVNGSAGGSGGGGGYNYYSTVFYGGSGVSGEGNAGGNTSLLSWAGGAGGGGAGGVGGDNKTGHGGGDAGIGLAYTITGSSVTYAEGGTGGSNSPGSSTANTGNGGDAAYASGTAYAGADGIVIIRYPINNDGAITGATWTNAGKFGKALSFNGSSDYVDIGDNFNMGANDFTLSTWVKPGGTGYRAIISKGDAGIGASKGYRLRLESDSELLFTVTGDAEVGLNPTGKTLSSGNWYHVVATKDSSDMKIYVNGAKWGSASSPAGSIDNAINAFIGTQGAWYWNGQIDEVKIYNYALTEDEIKNEYNQGKVVSMSGEKSPTTDKSFYYCVPGDTSPCDSPVGEWHFEEHSGTIANDSSGNGNDGTLTNMEESDWTLGKVGGALEFDGGNDYVNMASDPPLYNTDFTIEFWAKCSDKHSWPTVWTQSGGPNVQQFATCHTGGNGGLAWWYTSGAIYGDSSISADVWHHVVAVYDHSATKIKFYLNGKSDSNWQTVPIYNIANTNTYIGYWGGTQNFKGKIDQVRVYDYARTPAQIAWDYNKGKPVAHWRFDEGQGTTMYDDSDNDNDGTLELGASDQTSAGSVKVSGNTAWYNGRQGKQNYSLNFDGTDDYVDHGNILDITGPLTISAWVNFTTDGAIVVNGEASSLSWTTYYLRLVSGKLRISIGGASSTGATVDSINNVGTSGWHHVVGLWDGTTSAAGVRVYIDGQLDGSGTSTTPEITYSGKRTGFYIGSDASNSRMYFDGQIDDVRIYNYALTAEQIKGVYNFGATRFGGGN